MKKIPLTKGEFSLVDDEDFNWLMAFRWQLLNKTYAVHNAYLGGGRANPRRKLFLMHRLIMGTPEGMETDHINGDKLDNRTSNLRICTHGQNQANTPSRRKYRGVYPELRSGGYIAKIRHQGKDIYLGTFNDPRSAAVAYDKAAKKYHRDFATLNLKLR